MKKIKIINTGLIILLILISLTTGCIDESESYDTNTELPTGEPAFPEGQVYGIIDPYNIISEDTAYECFLTLQELRNDGIAEVAILIQPGVQDPEMYATLYGRYAELGEIDKNNGLVWLIRPDVNPNDGKITYSIGRGLPKLTSVDMGEIMIPASEPINFGDYDQGVKVLVQKTDQKLREIYE